VLTGYNLCYGAGANPAQSDWKTIISATNSVNNGTLAAWNTRGLPDGTYTLWLTVNKNAIVPENKSALNTIIIDNSPAPPASITAKDTPYDGGGSLTILWALSADDGAGNNDVQSYQLYKSTWTGGFTPLVTLNAGVTSYIDNNCPVYTTFYYVVTAIDRNSESGYSGVVGAFSLADGVMITPDAGGTVSLTVNGLTTDVVIEPHTFAQNVWVGIGIPSMPSAAQVSSARETSILREFGLSPASAVFLKSVKLKIPYSPADVAGIARENLRLYWLDTEKNEWRTVNTSDPLSENGRVWAVVPHFSIYRIMGYVPGSEELLSESKVYTYPNPAKGDKLSFKYYLGSKADVKVDVYNVAGQLIAHFEKDNNPAGIASEFEWNMQNIASGVYIWRIEARSGSETKAIKKKLAVIH
jgi:hypothetical protein